MHVHACASHDKISGLRGSFSLHSMKERPNEWAVILVFLSRGQSFVRPSEDVGKIEMALERKKVPHPCRRPMPWEKRQ